MSHKKGYDAFGSVEPDDATVPKSKPFKLGAPTGDGVVKMPPPASTGFRSSNFQACAVGTSGRGTGPSTADMMRHQMGTANLAAPTPSPRAPGSLTALVAGSGAAKQVSKDMRSFAAPRLQAAAQGSADWENDDDVLAGIHPAAASKRSREVTPAALDALRGGGPKQAKKNYGFPAGHAYNEEYGLPGQSRPMGGAGFPRKSQPPAHTPAAPAASRPQMPGSHPASHPASTTGQRPSQPKVDDKPTTRSSSAAKGAAGARRPPVYDGTPLFRFPQNASEEEELVRAQRAAQQAAADSDDDVVEIFDAVPAVERPAPVASAAPRARPHVLVVKSDLPYLQPGQFLNDTLIDLWLMLLNTRATESAAERDKLLFLSSFFYKKMRLADLHHRGAQFRAPSGGRISAVHGSVARWTKGVDVFSRETIFSPVNYDLHWSLLAVVNAPELDKWLRKADDALREHTKIARPIIVDGGGAGDAAIELDEASAAGDDSARAAADAADPDDYPRLGDDADGGDGSMSDVDMVAVADPDGGGAVTSDAGMGAVAGDVGAAALSGNSEGIISNVKAVLSKFINAAYDAVDAVASSISGSSSAGRRPTVISLTQSSDASELSNEDVLKLLPEFPQRKDLQPALLFFDSLAYHKREKVCEVFRIWAIKEWCERKNGGQPVGGRDGLLSDDVIKTILPDFSVKSPRQNNSCDCGVYLLRYVEDIMGKRLGALGSLWSFTAEDGQKAKKNSRQVAYPAEAFSSHDIAFQRIVMETFINRCTEKKASRAALSEFRDRPGDSGDKLLLEVYDAALTKVLSKTDDSLLSSSRGLLFERAKGGGRNPKQRDGSACDNEVIDITSSRGGDSGGGAGAGTL